MGCSRFIGARCDTKPTEIARDANGRIETDGCGGVNPGTLLIVAAARMKKQHLPFAIDAQNVSGQSSTRKTRMVAVLELDLPASNSRSKILGGEYVDDASAGADRLTVPPFLWTIAGPGAESLPSYVNGDAHNPYVEPSLVKQLIALGQK